MTSDVLLDTIRKAFATERSPVASENIVPPTPYEHLENQQTRDAFAGKCWAELTVPFLKYHRQAVFFFTPEAWAYFLPAYMLAIITHYDETDTMLNELLATLIPDRDGHSDEWLRARILALNNAQRATVAEFVEWAANEHPTDLEDDDRQTILASLRD